MSALEHKSGDPHPTDPTLVWSEDGYLGGDGWTTRLGINWLTKELALATPHSSKTAMPSDTDIAARGFDDPKF